MQISLITKEELDIGDHTNPALDCAPSTSFATNPLQCQSISDSKIKVPPKKFKNVRKSDGFKCVVCGDKPTGYHYDVLSCNGCKTFYRRTIIAGRSFSCTKGGKCDFDKDFRCACRACRFQKCVAVGMNAKGIQWPSGAKRKSVSSISVSEDDYSTDLSDSPPNLRAIDSLPQTIANVSESAYCGEIIDLLTKEDRIASIRDKCSLFTSHKLSDILKMPLILGSSQPSDRFRSDELQTRTEYFTKLYSINPIKFWMISDLHLVTEYSKSFTAFNGLSQMDKMVLLAHMGGLQLMISQSFYSAKNGHGTTTFPDGTVALEEIDNNSYRCSTVLRSVNTPWVVELFSLPVQLFKDLNLSDASYALLRAVALFSPVDDDLSLEGRKLISAERERLTDLLTRRLFSEHGSEAPMKMVGIQSMIQTMYRLNERRREQFIYFNVVRKDLQLSPLGRGVYLREKS
ncbi:nhr-120 [Pristionchus pacificus]|nr:nhr-120 [Pristionchus pacificus]